MSINMMGGVSREELLLVYKESRTIAVVGASDNPDRAAHRTPQYLQSQGYRIIPVTPKGGRILNEDAVRSLAEVDEPVDVVDVFRPPAEAEGVARASGAIGSQ